MHYSNWLGAHAAKKMAHIEKLLAEIDPVCSRFMCKKGYFCSIWGTTYANAVRYFCFWKGLAGEGINQWNVSSSGKTKHKRVVYITQKEIFFLTVREVQFMHLCTRTVTTTGQDKGSWLLLLRLLQFNCTTVWPVSPKYKYKYKYKYEYKFRRRQGRPAAVVVITIQLENSFTVSTTYKYK